MHQPAIIVKLQSQTQTARVSSWLRREPRRAESLLCFLRVFAQVTPSLRLTFPISKMGVTPMFPLSAYLV